jgi:hypothetical protein
LFFFTFTFTFVPERVPGGRRRAGPGLATFCDAALQAARREPRRSRCIVAPKTSLQLPKFNRSLEVSR